MLTVLTLEYDGLVGKTEIIEDEKVTREKLFSSLPHLVHLLENEPLFLERFGRLFNKDEWVFIRHYYRGWTKQDLLGISWQTLFATGNCLVRFGLSIPPEENYSPVRIFQSFCLDKRHSMFIDCCSKVENLLITLNDVLETEEIEDIKRKLEEIKQLQ